MDPYGEAPVWPAPLLGSTSAAVRAVQVDPVKLTPRVESAWFQLLERTSLSSRWFQIDSTCTPTTRRPPYTEVFAAELKNAVGGGCRLDPGLKGKRPVSQKFQPIMKIKFAFKLNLVSELAPQLAFNLNLVSELAPQLAFNLNLVSELAPKLAFNLNLAYELAPPTTRTSSRNTSGRDAQPALIGRQGLTTIS